MKTALTSVITGVIVALAFAFSGRPFDAADFVVVVFATSIVAWTIEQYHRPNHLP